MRFVPYSNLRREVAELITAIDAAEGESQLLNERKATDMKGGLLIEFTRSLLGVGAVPTVLIDGLE